MPRHSRLYDGGSVLNLSACLMIMVVIMGAHYIGLAYEIRAEIWSFVPVKFVDYGLVPN